MRFIGNKENIVKQIYYSIVERGIDGKTFFDFFAGTASVGRFFKKKGYEVYSSDMLYFSYCLQKAYIENNSDPQFTKLSHIIKQGAETLFLSPLDAVLEFLNSLEPIEGFLYQNYAPGGTMHLAQPRMYLSDENAKKIDAVRSYIKYWHEAGLLTDNEYHILLACLIESVSLFSNVSGVYAAFQKRWDRRALKEFKIKAIEIIAGCKNHRVFYKNSMELLPEITTDILYLDPPYNARQYAPNYHLMETIAKYDSPEIYGVTGMRPYREQKSSFCKKDTALQGLNAIAQTADYKYLLLSYNNEGLMKEDEIKAILSLYGNLETITFDYTRFKSHNHGENKKKVIEQLYLLKR